MTFAKEIVVWMALWIGGCVVFDALLGLTGGWLMSGGVITYELCNMVRDRMRSNVQIEGLAATFPRESMIGRETEKSSLIGQSRSNAGLERMLISEREHVALIKATENGRRYVGCSFGAAGVWLLPTQDNKWAYDMIANLRSNVQIEGLADHKTRTEHD